MGHIGAECENEKNEAAADLRKCYNCGKPGHLSSVCELPQGNRKCYLCQEEGHIARLCPTVAENETGYAENETGY